MAFDILTERRLSVSAAAKRLKISVGCCWRWVLYGIKGGIKLDSALIGGKRFTSEEAIERFVERINAPTTTTEVRTPKQRQKQIEAAERELAAAGI